MPRFAVLRAALPQGRTLPDEVFHRRHGWMLRLVWAHVVALPLLALILGASIPHALFEGMPVASFAILASRVKDRRLSATLVALGMLSASATLVHVCEGLTEAHFHFFVMIGVLTLFEDWLPFLVAVGYVLLHHGVMGTISPEDVYREDANPLLLAGLHAAFVAAAGTANVLTWRLNEDVRAEMRDSLVATRDALETANEAVSEREAAERELHNRAAQQAAIAEFGRHALEGAPLDEVMWAATSLAERVLGVDIAAVMEHVPDEDVLVIRAGAATDTRGGRVPAGMASQSGATFAQRRPIIVADWGTETRFGQSETLKEAGAKSGLTVVIEGRTGPWGVFGAQSCSGRVFTAEDTSFMEAVANTLAVGIERWRSEEEVRHNALHDPLTGLPNRTLFMDRLRHALSRSRRTGHRPAVLFVDLDHFKVVNDSLGHAAGDELLRRVAPRLSTALRAHDTIARFGGDELIVLCEDVDDEVQARLVGERLLATFDEGPFAVFDDEVHVTASVGIALADAHSTPESLVRDADAAMYRSKEDGRARVERFDERLRRRVLDRLRLEGALRRAVEQGEFTLAYQPIVSLCDGAPEHVEALMRWNSDELGPVSPAEFIPLAEETGLIVPLGRWALDRACRDAAAWRAAGEPASVYVNISPRQLAQSDFAAMVAAVLEDTGLEPGGLGLEITESVLMEQGDRPVRVLCELRELGVRVILDDFGTGYSSLGYLKELPLDTVKLDRAFISGLDEPGNESSSAIVSAVVTMAHALELTVVGEGVETSEQADRLRRLGCAMAQGFWFARPEPAPNFATARARTGSP
jgi:diguanylate cyclase (GGDEF)-like protein